MPNQIKPAIFIRTYRNDFEWLVYCLRSIAKFAPDVPTLVVAPDFSGFDYPPQRNLVFRFCQERHPDGYVAQQLSKLFADQAVAAVHPDTTHIIHIDSDTVLTGSVEALFRDGKPYLLRTPFSDLPSDAQAWRAPTEKHLGFPVTHETMRRLPLVYPVSLYATLRLHLASRHHHDWQLWGNSIEGRQLSEFNLLGSFAWQHPKFHDAFAWVDTDKDPLPPTVAKQHWSWGGIAEHREQLERDYPAT
jgi:hypothetical protein